MKCLFKVAFILIFTSVLHAQQITVRDFSTDLPIPNVLIYNQDKSKSVVTNLKGTVSLDIFSDVEILTFQHISYISRTLVKTDISTIFYLEHDEQYLDEVVISASKFEQNKKEVAQKIISLKAEEIIFNNPQTSADLLQNSGQVFIQKSQLGGGSPMIRGFSTNRLLLSVDGVRMNNAIFRGGNVQNVISIDPFTVSNTEVILGAGSVIYGSDAIGGVMNFYTTRPKLSREGKTTFQTNALTRYSTANNEKTGHVDLNIGKEKWAFLSSVSFTDFDDLRMGRHGPDDYLRPEYVQSNGGIDNIVENDDPRLQRFTGYNQINLMQKVHYKANEKISYDLGLHYSTTSDYPRYDRLIRYSDSGELLSAEWEYGPQRWFLGNFQITKRSSSSNLYDKLKYTASYQRFEESRIDRDFNSENRRTREDQVDAITTSLDLEKSVSNRSKISYGAEYVYNRVGSSGIQTDIFDGTQQPITSRYPDGSSWHSAAAYFNYKYKPGSKLTLQSGIRYNHIVIRADLRENSNFFDFPFDNSNLDTGALTGTFGLSWIPNETIQWKFNATTAFRAPNIDDVGKIFDSEPGSVVVPNAQLKPEYAYGGEVGVLLNFNDVLKLDLATYYTYLDNALVRRDYAINGEVTQIIYDGQLSDVQAIQNASKAWIYGFEAGLTLKLTDKLNLISQYSVVGGSEEDVFGTEVPVRHVAPAFGNTRIRWDDQRFSFELQAVYNNELSFNQLAPSEIDKDFIYALDENGNPFSPSWYTLNARSRYHINNSLMLTAALENITNQRYRPYSSGISAPGTNLILALKYSM